ncbi:MAG TPA: Thivi_2564 family membrane protein [Rhizomicrobium sp.]
MSLISLIVALAVVGLFLWLVNTFIPMDARIRQILNVVVLIVVVIWLLQVFGLLGDLGAIRVGR